MTRKDSEKDSDRPHYYSQFWLDIAAGRRVIGAPKEETPEPAARPRQESNAASNGNTGDYEDSYEEEEEEVEPEAYEPEEEIVEDEDLPDVEFEAEEEEEEPEEEDFYDEEEEEEEDDIGWGRGGRKKPKPGRQPARPQQRKPAPKRDTRRH